MRLFIAWSGVRGYQIAEALANFIREVFPKDEVRYFFSADIEPGTIWFSALEKKLKKADAILFCVTREGLHSPWVHYEVGTRIGSNKQSRVYTYLLGVQPAELSGPIGKYQTLESTEEGTRRLVKAISGKSWKKLEKPFQKAWPKLQAVISKLRHYTIQELIPGFDRLFLRKTFQEPMEECMDQTWLDRYYGARQTVEKLQEHLKLTDERWQPYQIAILHEIISEIDGYTREMRRHLIHEVQFNHNNKGKLNFQSPRKKSQGKKFKSAKWSDKRCEKIRQLVAQLLNPKGAPVLAEAPYFMTLKPFWYKKAYVHRIESEIHGGSFKLQEYEIQLCRSSFWDFDRIVFYLWVEKSKTKKYETERLIKQVKMEMEKLRARDKEEISAMPLNYSIRALASVYKKNKQKKVKQKKALIQKVRACRKEALDFVKANKLDKGGQIKKQLKQLKASIDDKI